MEIVKSSANRWYVKDYNKVVIDISPSIIETLAYICGPHSVNKSGFITFESESDCKQFRDIIERINNIPKELKAFLKEEKAYDLFVLNFNKGCGETLTNAFLWSASNEGHEFWSNLNKKYNENKLQNKNSDRPREDRSERDRVCCKGNEFECRFSNTRSRKTIDLSSERFEDCKINIPSRRTIVL